MHRSKFSPAQIAAAMKQAEAGIPVADLARRFGVSENRYSAGGPRTEASLSARSSV